MEKNIASHDLSDMMVYEGMLAQSQRFRVKQKFAHVKKVVEKGVTAVEQIIRSAKHFGQSSSSLNTKSTGFSSTATAVYSISVASVLIAFFWLTLLLSVTPG